MKSQSWCDPKPAGAIERGVGRDSIDPVLVLAVRESLPQTFLRPASSNAANLS